jgi:hypothetical protein
MTLTMNAFLKAGTAMSNYTSVLILLLVCRSVLLLLRPLTSRPSSLSTSQSQRMRQACSHPSLITGSNAALDREALADPDPASAVAAIPEEDDLSSLLSGLGSLSVAQGRQCALCDQSAEKGEEEPYCRRCQESMRGLGGVKMSTKVKKMLQVLEGIRKEDPKRKTIVFSQVRSQLARRGGSRELTRVDVHSSRACSTSLSPSSRPLDTSSFAVSCFVDRLHWRHR